MKRIVLLGSGGQLGWELERALAPLGFLYAFDFPQVDLLRVDSFYDLILEIKPQVIINAAAFTAVDQAESEPETAYAINGRAPGILAELAQRHRCGPDSLFHRLCIRWYKNDTLPGNRYSQST